MTNNIYTLNGKSRYTEKDKEVLRANGFTNFYELRTNETNAKETFIVNRAVFNNEGCLATNFEINVDNGEIPTLDEVMGKYQPTEVNIEGLE